MNIKEFTRPHKENFCRKLISTLCRKKFISRIELELMIEQEEQSVLNYLSELLEVSDPSEISGTVEWDEYTISQYNLCKEIYLNYIWEEYNYVETNT